MANVYLPDPVDTSIGNPIQSSWGSEVRAAIQAAAPAGVVEMFVGEVAPDGWLLMQGQTVVNFQALYPEAWQRMPTMWKTGSSVRFPDTRARVAVGAIGYGDMVLGAVGGANEASISLTQMPPHSHGAVTHIQDRNHGHGFGGSGTTSYVGEHYHGMDGGRLLWWNNSDAWGIDNLYAGGGQKMDKMSWASSGNGAHDHTYSFNGTTQGIDNDHAHGVNLEGGGATISRMQAHFAITFMIRVY